MDCYRTAKLAATCVDTPWDKKTDKFHNSLGENFLNTDQHKTSEGFSWRYIGDKSAGNIGIYARIALIGQSRITLH
jgi:hypothetical protein